LNGKKIAIMQPYFLPYIGYFQLINAVDEFIIYDDVNYIKQGFINRNYILSQGLKVFLTLETFGASSNKKINEVLIGNNKEKILKTIEVNYRKAPYFKNVFNLILEIMNFEENNLSRFVGNSLFKIVEYLNINTKIYYSSDLNYLSISKNKIRILEICNFVKANTYINLIGGIELYKKEDFMEKGIYLYFIKPRHIIYNQFNNVFIPNLSIIDVLMFNDNTNSHQFLNEYDLI